MFLQYLVATLWSARPNTVEPRSTYIMIHLSTLEWVNGFQ